MKRVQKYVETLDVLKIKNSMADNNENVNKIHEQPQPKPQPASPILRNQEQRYSNANVTSALPKQQQNQHLPPFPNSRRSVGNFAPIPVPPKQQQPRNSTSGEVVVTTQWETFDSIPTALPPPPSSSTNTMQPKFSWDLL